EPLHLARLPCKRVERSDALDARVPALAGMDVDRAVDSADENDVPAQTVTELRGQGEAILVVDRVLVGSVEHRRGRGEKSPTAPHLTPLSPTAQPPRPTSSQRHCLRMDAVSRDRAGTAPRGEVECVQSLEAGGEAVRQARCEAIAGTVGIGR